MSKTIYILWNKTLDEPYNNPNVYKKRSVYAYADSRTAKSQCTSVNKHNDNEIIILETEMTSKEKDL